jgi:hypothetical protein
MFPFFLHQLILGLVLVLSHHQNGFSQINPASEADNKGGTSFPSGETFKNSAITYRIIPAPNKTWCYDILMEGRLFIHQPNAPGLPGNEGFKTKKAAQRVAELVVSKMKRGEMPPSITIEEMKKLKAL